MEEKMKRTLVPIGDIHWGNALCDKPLVKRNIRRCGRSSVDEVWLVGDLIEYVNKRSVGKQIIPISQQITEIVKMLKPLKDKITLILTGNHEERAERGGDINPTLYIASQLRLEDKYKGFADFDFSDTFKRTYYTEHPLKGGGTTMSYFDLLFRKYIHLFKADIYIISHFHRLDHMIPKLQYYNKDKYNLIHMILTGGYVKYWSSYGHTKHMMASELGSPLITFDLDKYRITMKKMM